VHIALLSIPVLRVGEGRQCTEGGRGRRGGIGGGVKGKEAGEEERSSVENPMGKVMSVVKVIYLFLRRSGWSTL
jgi:hypothetical protein